MSHSINVARSSPKIAEVVVQEIVLMWFRSVGRVVWVGNADGRGGGVGGGGGDGLGEDGVPEKRVRRGIGAWKGAVVVIVVVGVGVGDGGGQGSVDNADHGHTGQSGRQRRNPDRSQ